MEETKDILDIKTQKIDKLYNELIKIMKLNTISHSNIIEICILLMKSVENYKGLVGEEKKEMVIYVIKKFINNTTYIDDKSSLLHVIDITLPILIDTVIGLDKNEIKIAMEKTIKKCFPCC